MNNLISQDYLMHHGVKGMKWGVRKSKETSRKLLTPNEKNKNKTPAETMTSELSKSAKTTEKYIRSTGKTTRRVSLAKRDPRTMSDQELQQAVYRMNLERQYSSLTSVDVQTGYGKTADILNTFGTVLAVGGSALSIYATIKGLK